MGWGEKLDLTATTLSLLSLTFGKLPRTGRERELDGVEGWE